MANETLKSRQKPFMVSNVSILVCLSCNDTKSGAANVAKREKKPLPESSPKAVIGVFHWLLATTPK